jgi:hypothetical protein
MGYHALFANTTGMRNTAMGYQCLSDNTSGDGNTALGNLALQHNTTASNNIAVGDSALYQNTTGQSNLAVGSAALKANVTGQKNVALGREAMRLNQEGSYNVAVGLSAMEKNTDGERNTAVGYLALLENSAGTKNTAVGSESLYFTGGSENAALGYGAGGNDFGSSNRNTYVGSFAGSFIGNNPVKSDNVMIGYKAGSASTGSGNVFIGREAGTGVTASNKLYIENSPAAVPLIYGDFDTERVGIGMNTPDDALSVRATPADNAFRVQVGTSTKLRIFNNGSISLGSNNAGVSADDVYVHNQLGLGVSSPVYRLELPNSTANAEGRALANAWNTYSDRRVKSEIRDNPYGMNAILQLRPVAYHHHASVFESGKLLVHPEARPEIGFIAQEVAAVLPEAVNVPADDSAALWSMDYTRIVPVLVTAIQEQQAQIEALLRRIDHLENRDPISASSEK